MSCTMRNQGVDLKMKRWEVHCKIIVNTKARNEDDAKQNAFDYIFKDSDRGDFIIEEVKETDDVW